jgi:AcrR family transcriptional regulator
MELPLPSEPRGRDATRQRILEVALELFGRYGFEGTSVKAIGEQSGLTDGALYYHFRSKREILDALWDTAEARVLGVAPPDEHLTVERLMYLVDLMFDAAAEQDMLLRIMIRQALGKDRVAMELRNQTMAYWKQYLVRQFETCLPLDEAAAHADALASLILGVTFTTLIDHGDRFAEVCRSPDFRAQVHDLVRLTLPFCRSGEDDQQCEPSSSA